MFGRSIRKHRTITTTALLFGITLALSWSCAGAPAGCTLTRGGALWYSTDRATTRFELQLSAAGRYAVTAPIDGTVLPTALPARVDIVGEVTEHALLLVDTYASRPDGKPACQAGEERFLRLISFDEHRATLTYSTKLASCREDIELDAGGIEWHLESSTLRVHWLTGPRHTGTPEALMLKIRPDGEPILL